MSGKFWSPSYGLSPEHKQIANAAACDSTSNERNAKSKQLFD
jgi:hypothetical protein